MASQTTQSSKKTKARGVRDPFKPRTPVVWTDQHSSDSDSSSDTERNGAKLTAQTKPVNKNTTNVNDVKVHNTQNSKTASVTKRNHALVNSKLFQDTSTTMANSTLVQATIIPTATLVQATSTSIPTATLVQSASTTIPTQAASTTIPTATLVQATSTNIPTLTATNSMSKLQHLTSLKKSIASLSSVATHCRALSDEEVKKTRDTFALQKSVVISNVLNKSFAEGLGLFVRTQIPNDQWHLHCHGASTANASTDVLEKQYTRGVGETIIPLYTSTNDTEIQEQHSNLMKKRWDECGKATNNTTQLSYRFYRAGEHQSTCNCIVCRVKSLFQTADFLNYMDLITNNYNPTTDTYVVPKLTRVWTSFVSRYRRGCYLGAHSDVGRGRLAFVCNLTKQWMPQWGGELHILESDWRTTKRVVAPEFNSLVLFEVPKGGVPHFVSQVGEHVEEERYAISGWFD